MILSEERQSHLAHLMIDGIWKDDLVDYQDDDLALKIAKRAISDFVSEVGSVDDRVRAKILSLKRTLIEGSTEWDIMYQKYYEQELNKRG